MGWAHTVLTFLGAAAFAGAASGQSLSGAEASVTTSGSVTILDPIALGQATALAASPVARPKTGSSLANVDGATFTLSGLGGETYSVSAPSVISLKPSGGGDELRLTLSPSQTTGVVPGAAGAPGSTSIAVNATLPLSASTSSGAYVGRYGLTVSYP